MLQAPLRWRRCRPRRGFQDVFGGRDLAERVAVDGEKCSAVLDAAFVALGFILGDAHADQGSDETAYCAADSEPGERGHDGAGSDEWTNARYGECSDACQQSERSADYSASRSTCGCAFGRLGVFLVSEIASAGVILQQD